MGSNWGDLLRIGVFYDGQYFYHVSNYYNYQHRRKARISLHGLHEFIREEISTATGHDKRLCQIVDAHYFRGRYSAQQSEEKNKLLGERQFDDILMNENVVTHYLPIKYGRSGIPQEKGIDVWLALEAYELAIYKRFDILVLIACDGDYVPLVRKLNTLGSQVMLLSWDFKYTNDHGKEMETRTAQSLIDEVSYLIAMIHEIDARENQNNPIIDNLFAPRKNDILFNAEQEISIIPNSAMESTILNLKEGFGFIKDDMVNNVFFFHTSLVNCDFYDLAAGMKVRYLREEQEDGKFIASKVWTVN